MSEMQHRGKLRKPILVMDRKLQDPLLTGFVPIYLPCHSQRLPSATPFGCQDSTCSVVDSI